jgi:Ser/Thr protein kinase RdoA (MazF antagonist)
VLPSQNGERVVTAEVDGVARHAVLFEVAPGIERDELKVPLESFETLGRITARMHQHARSWQRPAGFRRFSWDWPSSLGENPRWGRWQDGIGVGGAEERILGAAADLVRQRLEAYGQEPDRYGLAHADLRLANLLAHDDQVTVIDFDDCGFTWYLYDFGTAVSFLEDDPRLPQWQDAWLRGYRDIAPVTAEDEDMLATFVMLRRLLLVAWMGSHSHSRECQVKGPGYTAASCELARRYLASGGHSLL